MTEGYAAVKQRTITPEILNALRRTNPIEAAAAEILIRRGVWGLADEGGEKRAA